MSNYLEESGLIISMKDELEKERALATYDGDYRVVPSSELKADLDKKGKIEVKGYDCGFPFLGSKIGQFEPGNLITVTGYSGNGKCHGKGTEILMYDGSIKKVEDIVIGDIVMGDDSTPRKVLSLCRGVDQLYKVNGVKGNSYIVNSEHILSLYNSSSTSYGGHKYIDISVKDFLNKSKGYQDMHKGYRAPVEFKEREVPLDPYLLGLWLGDGTCSKPEITTRKKDLIEYIYNSALNLNLNISTYKEDTYSLVRKRINKPKDKRCKTCFDSSKSFTEYLKELNVLNNKHIPDIYKINSRENRLKILAGLIDTDGHINNNCYEIVSAYKTLAKDIVFIARSLGFAANISIKKVKGYTKDYYRISISGDLSVLPTLIKKIPKRRQIKNVLHYGITIESLGKGNYYGFELDGNHRYLLADFTVTHNSSLLHALTRNMAPNPILWFSYENTPAQFFRKFEDIELPLFYLPIENKPYDLEWFKERVNESIIKYGVKIVMIDHLHYLLDLFQSKNTSLDIGNMLRALKVLAVEKELVIFLVAHTKQPKASEEPDMGSLRDSSFIVQESDKVLAVHRIKSSIDSRSKVIILKDRDHGDVWNQYSEFIIKNKLLSELEPWKQGENIKEAINSREEGERNLAALKQTYGKR